MKYILVVCCALFLGVAGVALPSAAVAQTPAASPAPSPARKTRETTNFRGPIESADATAKTFTIKGKKVTRTFKVTAKTNLLKRGGGNASFDDLKAGAYVTGSGRKTAENAYDAVLVKVGPKDEAPAARKTPKPAAASPAPSPAH